MIPLLPDVVYPGVVHDMYRIMLALVLGHVFHHNVLLLLVLSACSLPLLMVSWLHGGNPFLVISWAFSLAEHEGRDSAMESAGVLKRGGGIRRKFRDSFGSIGGNAQRIWGSGPGLGI